MRIISGKAKGLKLAAPPAKSRVIRPTSDRSREALFSIIGGRLSNAKILDLYAGTGALGLEAMSRGSGSAVFVDHHALSLSLIKKNIAAFTRCIDRESWPAALNVLSADLRKGLQPLKQLQETDFCPFDIIFLDPPYDKGLALRTLTHLDNSDFIAKDGLIIVEERTKTDMPVDLVSLVLQDTRKYGDTGFWIYTTKH